MKTSFNDGNVILYSIIKELNIRQKYNQANNEVEYSQIMIFCANTADAHWR